MTDRTKIRRERALIRYALARRSLSWAGLVVSTEKIQVAWFWRVGWDRAYHAARGDSDD